MKRPKHGPPDCDALNAPSNLFEYVKCDYTGGGIWVFSALYNREVWLYGGLDNCVSGYDAPGDVIENEYFNDFDSHEKHPVNGYPTWRQVLNAIRRDCDEYTCQQAERLAQYFTENMNSPCNT